MSNWGVLLIRLSFILNVPFPFLLFSSPFSGLSTFLCFNFGHKLLKNCRLKICKNLEDIILENFVYKSMAHFPVFCCSNSYFWCIILSKYCEKCMSFLLASGPQVTILF
uniref:Uncharacterized protein n=1 Tax=Arundo donax TaxID=35708 RepID=A0A0A9B9T5_ARUDO